MIVTYATVCILYDLEVKPALFNLFMFPLLDHIPVDTSNKFHHNNLNVKGKYIVYRPVVAQQGKLQVFANAKGN